MSRLRPSSVLLVDDDPDHARIAGLVLGTVAPDLPVAVCRDAAAAILALAEQPRGALVLVDRMLAGVESFDSVVRMHAIRPDVTIVMLSSALSSIDRAYALACGAREAIEKPSSLGAWRDALAALVGPGAAPGRSAHRAA